jgi:hypothetical protein
MRRSNRALAATLAIVLLFVPTPGAILEVAAEEPPPCTAETPWPEALLGGWEGTWDNGTPARLVVEEIGPAAAGVVYAWGAHPAGAFPAGWSRRAARVERGGVLTWGGQPQFLFALLPQEGVLGGLYLDPAGVGSAEVRLTRCRAAAPAAACCSRAPARPGGTPPSPPARGCW